MDGTSWSKTVRIHPGQKAEIIKSRLKKAYGLLSGCRVCPRACGADRLHGETGFCGVGFLPMVSSDNLHHGEEPPISGWKGSGTIFFTGCNLGCIFCQNYPISHLGNGNVVSIPKLASMMLRLQRAGAHNINFVTPSHFVPQILGALRIAYVGGLSIPLVYNTSGYDSMESLALLDGIVDIYMPDMKYSDSEMSKKYSNAPDYPEVNRKAVLEMHRQVGPLILGEDGIAETGLMIRHLVLPEGIAGTGRILKFIAEKIGKHTYISLMSQYFPAHHSTISPPLDRRILSTEYDAAKEALEEAGLERGWVQSDPTEGI